MIWYVSALCLMIGFMIGKTYVKYSEEINDKPKEDCEYRVIHAYSPSSAYSAWADLRRMIEITGFNVEVIDIKVYDSNIGQTKFIFYYKKTKTTTKSKGAK